MAPSNDPVLFATTISNLLATARSTWIPVTPTQGAFDFFIEDDKKRRVALELTTSNLTPSLVDRLVARLEGVPDISVLLIVTLQKPSFSMTQRAEQAARPVKIIWINDLPQFLGIPSPGDLLDPKTQARLQIQAVMKDFALYREGPLTPAIEDWSASLDRQAEIRIFERQSRFLNLRRQLPFKTIAALDDDPRDVSDVLSLGQRVGGVTVVLSDLKNFSSLVTASSPELLRDSMSRYYLRARALVFENGGMLDKFIGDAVLAVFGYPLASPTAALDAVRFGRALIELGATTLTPWSKDINAVLETGTRVGIASGDIWPINIGDQETELSLLGDTINLAARLEKNSHTNAILLANTTRTRALALDAAVVASWNLHEEKLTPENAKGQAFDLRAWRMPPLMPAIMA